MFVDDAVPDAGEDVVHQAQIRGQEICDPNVKLARIRSQHRTKQTLLVLGALGPSFPVIERQADIIHADQDLGFSDGETSRNSAVTSEFMKYLSGMSMKSVSPALDQ